ncbi:MAG: DnaB-like helicase C-terminal domain-containing protein [Desulfurivibrionaceae bacterium]|nr:DnaB-like helicase C-terminal domain-containing protein [Desulfurivibrionaceae bacterium]
MALHEKLARFYQDNLPGAVIEGTTLKAPCPFCASRGRKEPGTLVVFLDEDSFFAGYFRCLSRCVAGGFAPHFARLRLLDADTVPGYDPDQQPYVDNVAWPLKNINQDILKYQNSMTSAVREGFSRIGVGPAVLQELRIGFNGRYIVYPYFQENGCCYAAHCLAPQGSGEEFWYGEEALAAGEFRLFNLPDIGRCQGGALFVVEGEENLLCLREQGYPGVAVPRAADLAALDSQRFAAVETLFMVVNHTPESEASARLFASRLGFKARLLKWPGHAPRDFNLARMAQQEGDNFRAELQKMIRAARAFSPFNTPDREYTLFLENLERRQSASYQALKSGMPCLDEVLGGIHGINIIGGAPKAGKSCLAIQLASQMAASQVPVIYYDFENGRQKIYQRTMARLSRLPVARFNDQLEGDDQHRFSQAQDELRTMMFWFRVVNDRQLNPEIMRRHVDFLRHETHRQDAVIVIDSLHKLPFKDFSERRTGIDAWLREMESIRDEYNVAFLVISELNRQEGGRYDGVPHMGMFKGSGDIEYTADNALVFLPDWDPVDSRTANRVNSLWLVASRENSPGLVARYHLDYPFWGFRERAEE